MTAMNSIKSIFKNNEKVVENYFFMTALQVISSAFGILIYPYLIRVLGSESYGSYVFAVAIVSYFLGLISFGFHYPALKTISQNADDIIIKTKTVSAIFTAKTILLSIAVIIFIILLFLVPYMRINKILFLVIFAQVTSDILYPAWFYQAVQKMAIVTYIQLFFRIASLPFIFIFINTPNDIILYAFIATLSIILPAFGLFLYMIYNEKIRVRLLPLSQLKSYFSDALPFLWSDAAGLIKQESVTVIIGAFFGMREVALYDLANKIIIIPRMLTKSINSAIFPKVINNLKTQTIKRILRYEWMIGFAIVSIVILFGYWVILLLGGAEMTDAYPLAIILSFSIIVWLVVGSYVNFIFVPQNKYYFITQNQLVALISFMLVGIPAVLITNNIWAIVGALTFSGFCEIAYCKYLISKNKML